MTESKGLMPCHSILFRTQNLPILQGLRYNQATNRLSDTTMTKKKNRQQTEELPDGLYIKRPCITFSFNSISILLLNKLPSTEMKQILTV